MSDIRSEVQTGLPTTQRAVGLTHTQLGLLTGILLALVAAIGGFGAFMIAVVLGAIGLVVGRVLDGKLDLAAMLGRASSRR